jgi:hypothetical protein
MKALSIMQPWAHLITTGQKDVENRTWWTAYRHAGKKADRDFDVKNIAMHLTIADDLDLGGIVGQAVLVDCVASSASPWFFGPYGFMIRHAEPLPFRPCLGALGFFRPEFDYTPPPAKDKPVSRQGSFLT